MDQNNQGGNQGNLGNRQGNFQGPSQGNFQGFQQGQNPPDFAPLPSSENNSSMEELTKTMDKYISTFEERMQKVEGTLRNQQASIQVLENQMGQILRMLSERPHGSLLSNMEENPKGRLQAITLRSEKKLGEDHENPMEMGAENSIDDGTQEAENDKVLEEKRAQLKTEERVGIANLVKEEKKHAPFNSQEYFNFRIAPYIAPFDSESDSEDEQIFPQKSLPNSHQKKEEVKEGKHRCKNESIPKKNGNPYILEDGSIEFENGDKVLYLKSIEKPSRGKLFRRWSGPFTMKKMFPNGKILITDPNKGTYRVHFHNLKPYEGGRYDDERRAYDLESPLLKSQRP